MPNVYEVSISDGRVLEVESETEPTEDELFSALSSWQEPQAQPPAAPPESGTPLTPESFTESQRNFPPSQPMSPWGDIAGQPDTGFTDALYNQFPRDIGHGFEKVMGPIERVAADTMNLLAEMGVNAAAGPGNQFVPQPLERPLAEPGKTIVPGLEPAQGAVGIIPSLRRAAAGMTTPGMLATLPIAAESKLAQGAFFAGATASVPQALQAVTEAKTAAETRGALSDLALSAGFAGLIGKGLAREKPLPQRSQPAVPREVIAAEVAKPEPLVPVVEKSVPVAEAKPVEEVKPAAPVVEEVAATVDPLDAMPVADIGKLQHPDGIRYGLTLTEKDVPMLEAKYKEASDGMAAAFESGNDAEVLAAFGRNNFYGGALQGVTKGKHAAAGGNYDIFLERQKAEAAKAASVSPPPIKETVADVDGPASISGGTPPAPAATVAPVVKESLSTEPATKPSETTGEIGQGPGARTRTASQKPEPPESVEGTGLKHAIDELEREVMGFGERPQQERQGMAAAFVRAGETLAKDSLAGQRLADNLIANPRRGLTGDESALLLRHKVDAQNALNNAAEKTFTGTPEARAEASVEYETLSAKFRSLLDAINERGSEAGRELRWRQAIAYEDFTFATQERLLRASKGGEPLTNPERNKLLAEIESHKAKIAELEKKQAKQKGQESEADVADTVTTVRTQAKKDKAAGTVRDLEAEQKAVIDHLKEQFIENDADISGESLSIRKLMELLVEREGITERLKMEDRIHEILQTVDPTITREGAMDLMSNYGKSRLPNPAFAKRVVRDINAQILSVRKLLDYFQGNRPKLTGQLRDAPSQIQRDWLKMVNEAKKAFHLEDTGQNAKLIKSAIDAINTRLTNRIKDLKQEIVTRRKIIRERAPSPYNAETLRLRKELEAIQQAHTEIFGEPKLTDAQRLDRAEKSAARQIVELERQIKSGEIFSKTKEAFGLRSDKLDAAKARLEELKLTRQYARESIQPKPEPHEQFALNYLLRLRQRAAAYNERAAIGDFAKKERPVRELTPDVLKAMAEVEQSKQNFYQARYEAAQALRSTPRKIWDGIRDTKNAFLNIFSSYDLSAPRQMFLAMMANSNRMITSPVEGSKLMFKPLGKMFTAWASESKSAMAEQRRKNRPNALSGADKTAGIQYTELHTRDFTRGEENARSILDEWAKLPIKTGNPLKSGVTAPVKVLAKGVRMSNRAFITALNEMRADLFDHLLKVNFKDRAPTDADLRVIGNLVNVSTGRGKLSRGVAKVTGEVLWSPSLLASRLQVLMGQPLWTGLLSGDARGSIRARKIVAKEYARWIISGAALYAISRMFSDDDEAEITSSDAGKVIRGNTRIDPWAGFQQPIVAASRIVTGESTNLEGKVRDINAGEVIWNFFKNKTRPDIVAMVKAAIAAIDSGKDDRDVRVTPSEAARSVLPIPLALQEVIAVMREQGMAEGAIIQALSEFGVGVANYEETERQR